MFAPKTDAPKPEILKKRFVFITFSLVIDDVQKNAKRETGERILGTDPKTGRQLSVKLGKYGPIAQIGKVDEDEKPISFFREPMISWRF